MLLAASKKAGVLGSLNNSFTNGKGNIIGFLGEELFSRFLGIESTGTFNFDFIMDEKKYEVKSKHCVCKPKLDYECSVAKTSMFQETDVYVFTRILDDFSKGWILGYISKTDFLDKAVFHKKGEYDPTNDFSFKVDCYNISIHNLNIIQDISKYVTP